MPLKPESRFFGFSGECYPGGQCTWHIMDWDQRRWYSVTGSEECLPDFEDGIRMASKYVDSLEPDQYSMTVADDGSLVSSGPEDPTIIVQYPLYDGPLGYDNSEVSRRSEIIEVDRLSEQVDLVRYVAAPSKDDLLVFKYTIVDQKLSYIWKELQILKILRGNDRFVPLHRIVLDDVEPRILGFTTPFIFGGTLKDNQTRAFRFCWLEQITAAVDELNLRYGILHQDIAPRNILICPITGDIKVFDFDRAGLIGVHAPDYERMQHQGRDDVDGVIFTIYEALTKDEQFRKIPHWEQNVHKVEHMAEWPVIIPLEENVGGVTAYRAFLHSWASDRRTKRTISHYTEAPDHVFWPSLPPKLPWATIGTEPKDKPFMYFSRTQALKMDCHVIQWERLTDPRLKRAVITAQEDTDLQDAVTLDSNVSLKEKDFGPTKVVTQGPPRKLLCYLIEFWKYLRGLIRAVRDKYASTLQLSSS